MKINNKPHKWTNIGLNFPSFSPENMEREKILTPYSIWGPEFDLYYDQRIKDKNFASSRFPPNYLLKLFLTQPPVFEKKGVALPWDNYEFWDFLKLPLAVQLFRQEGGLLQQLSFPNQGESGGFFYHSPLPEELKEILFKNYLDQFLPFSDKPNLSPNPKDWYTHPDGVAFEIYEYGSTNRNQFGVELPCNISVTNSLQNGELHQGDSALSTEITGYFMLLDYYMRPRVG